MEKGLYIYLLFMRISQASQEEISGGIVNGQAVGKCVAGFCLPVNYSSLDPPTSADANQVSIETQIMDILVVRYLFGIIIFTLWLLYAIV